MFLLLKRYFINLEQRLSRTSQIGYIFASTCAFLCFCTHPVCLNIPEPSTDTMIGYYLSNVYERGPAASLISELKLNRDNTYILSFLAVRFGFGDIVTIAQEYGKWRVAKNKIKLKTANFEKTEVDSIYNPLPKKDIFVIDQKKAQERSIPFYFNMRENCRPRCGIVFTKQEKNIFKGMERKRGAKGE